MQSYLQFRQIGRQVRSQLGQNTHATSEKQSRLQQGNNSGAQSRAPFDNGHPRDLEKTADSPSSASRSPLSEPANDAGEEREEVEPPQDLHHASNDHEVRPALSRTPSLSRASTRSLSRIGTRLGLRLSGIEVRDRRTNEGGEGKVFVVSYHDDQDPINPHNWSYTKRVFATINVALVGIVVGWASSIDSAALRPAAAEFGVSEVVESMATGLYLCGFGIGALVAGPFSETFGRNPVYIGTLFLYMIFIMASALAPNIGAQLAFRFLAGFFGSTPLTTAGGSIADMWSPLERVYTFPIFANAAFSGPVLGPVAGGWIAQSSALSWRWTEWITLIFSGLVLFIVVGFQPETYTPILLNWKAEHLRTVTGDDRYAGPLEIRQDGFLKRVRTALYRPLVMTAVEPIIILVALYLTVIYIVLFTFLDGYDYIFGMIYGTSEGITGTCFVGILIGLFLASALVPIIGRIAKRDLRKMAEAGIENPKLPPESRLWYSMLGGAVAIPISLFWMAWTSRADISIWSPLAASVLFGFGVLCVFISCYQYIIDAYETMAASGLASITLIRYVAAGGMVIVGIPFYENEGVAYTLTILACLSALMVPVPYLFFFYGPRIRAKSRYAPH